MTKALHASKRTGKQQDIYDEHVTLQLNLIKVMFFNQNNKKTTKVRTYVRT